MIRFGDPPMNRLLVRGFVSLAVAAAIALYPAVKNPWLLEDSRESAPLHTAAPPQLGPSFVVVVLDNQRRAQEVWQLASRRTSR